MYFDFSQVTDFKEILLQIPFDKLSIESSYLIKAYQYDSGEIESKNIYLLKSHSDREDFQPPLNFYKLLLNKPNYKYKQIDLKEVGSKSEESLDTSTLNGLYFYDDQKILNCNNDFFYNFHSDPICTSGGCDSSSGSKFMTYPGISYETGYCSYPCLNTQKCETLTEGIDLDYDNNNFCKNYLNNYNLFYRCVEYSKNYTMQFSGFYNSQMIKINLEKALQSYIIEFWFYPDFFLQANARKTQYTFPTYTKNFFFHSNVMDCYFVQTDRLVPYLYDSNSVIRVESIYNSNEWNKFVIHGKYLKDTDDYIKTVYVNHAFNQPFAFASSKASAYTSLLNITFCENKCQDINRENIHWTTGYYRDLRIWDGDLASYSEVVQYNDFYPSTDYTDRINSILCYLPLRNQYIANNKIRDLDGSKKFCSVLIEHGDYFLKKYNYGTKFDIIAGNYANGGTYSQHGSDPAFIDTCDTGCKRC